MLTLLLLFAGSAYYIITYKGEEVKNTVLTELNKQLLTKVEVDAVDLTFIKRFPYFSIELQNVRIHDTFSNAKDPYLIKSERVYLSFNIYNILSGKYKIRQLELEKGFVNIKYNKEGKDNFHFWKKKDKSDGEATRLELQRIKINNIAVLYADVISNQHYNLIMETGLLAGDFTQSEFELAIDGNVTINKLLVDKVSYLAGKKALINTLLQVSNNEKYVFKSGGIKIADLFFEISGDVINKSKNTHLNLELATNKAEITSLLSVIPKKYIERAEAYNLDGELDIKAKLYGTVSESQTPSIKVNYTWREGTITNNQSGLKVKDIDLKGYFSNGAKHTAEESIICLEQFNSSISGGTLNGNLVLRNLEQPSLSGKVDAAFNAEDLVKLLSIDTITNVRGKVNGNIIFDWPLYKGSSTKEMVDSYITSGELRLTNVAFGLETKNYRVKELNASLGFNNSDLKINSAQLITEESDLKINGYLENVIPYFLFNERALKVDADIVGDKVMLDELLAYGGTVSASSSNATYKMILPKYMKFNLSTDIKELRFRKFKAENVYGNLLLNERKIYGNNFKFNTMGGEVEINFAADGSDTSHLDVINETKLTNVNVDQLFYQLENFNQTYLTEKNVKGELTSNLSMKFKMSNELELNTESIIADAELLIEKGELIDYAPMMELSKYIEVTDLKRIKFGTLKNKIQISKRTISIPQMEIKSNAMNILISGTHTFDNYLDYHFTVALKDILSKKAKKKKENLENGESENNEEGIKLYLYMKGPIDNLKFGYDRKELGKRLIENISSEKNEVKRLLREEFGLFKNDTTIKNKKPVKEKEVQIEWGEMDKKPENKESDGKKKVDKSSKDPVNANTKDSKLKKILKEKEEYENSEKYQ